MIKDILKKILFGPEADSSSYIEYLRRKGMKIGEDCTIYSPRKTVIDEQYPWLISIGNHVRITEGVILLTHDYSWSVLKRVDIGNGKGAILGAAGTVDIGNNVFIGMNSIILRNTVIEDNVIIGAGSVVSKKCESGWVYAGNPAKKIMTVLDFYKKRENLQLDEAKTLARKYYERFHEIPPKETFHEFFMLFEDDQPQNNVFNDKMKLCGNYNDSLEYIRKNKAKFSDYDEFIKFCLKEDKKNVD